MYNSFDINAIFNLFPANINPIYSPKWASPVAPLSKNPPDMQEPQETRVQALSQGRMGPLDEGRDRGAWWELKSIKLQRVRHEWSGLCMHTAKYMESCIFYKLFPKCFIVILNDTHYILLSIYHFSYIKIQLAFVHWLSILQLC